MIESQFIPYQALPVLPAQSVLVLAPHADDEVFGCGGALAAHVAAGIPVRVVVLTDGMAGGDAPSVVAEREAESRAAAAVLGYPAPEFWRLPDRGLGYGEWLVERLLTAIHETGADLVYAPSCFEIHPDHRALSMAAVEAVRRAGAGTRLAMYEVGVPLRPDTLVDITPYLPAKQEAMACFASQLARQRYDEQIASLNRYRAYTLPPAVQAAEAFAVFSAEVLAADPLRPFQSEYQRRQQLGAACVGEADLPLVSVIIRSMDRPSLTEALDSLALQTYPNIEVLVVNARGGLHRDPGSHCGRYPLRLVNQDGAPLHRCHAANAGLAAAHGAWLIFLDDDDTFDPDHLHHLVAAVRAQPGLVAAYAGVRVVDATGQQLGGFNFPFEPQRLWVANYIPIHALLFSRQAVEQAGLRFDPSLDVYEDWDFWMQLQSCGRFQHVDRVSATYRLTGSSGVVTNPDHDLIARSREKFYAKWLQHWRPAEVAEAFRHQEQRWIDLDQRRDREWHQQAEQIAALQSTVEQLQASLAEMDRQRIVAQDLARQNQALLLEKEGALQAVLNSTFWRLTAPLRHLLTRVRGGRAPVTAAPALAALSEERLQQLLQQGPWFIIHSGSQDDLPALRQHLAAQRYDRWRLAGEAVADEAAEASPASYRLLLTAADRLLPDALARLAEAVVAAPAAALVYADDRDHAGHLRAKPDWNPDLLWSMDYIGAIGAVRADVLVNGESAFADTAASVAGRRWAAYLAAAACGEVHHVALPLASGDSSSCRPDEACQVVAQALQQQGLPAQALPAADAPGCVRVQWPVPTPAPKASLIIPTRNRLDLLQTCVDSLFARTDYPDWEVLIVDNGSDDAATLAYLEGLQQAGRARVLRDPSPFNYAALNNAAVRVASGQVLVFLNNDVETIHPDWLTELVAQACRDGIGAVGARLWYPDDTLQHAGVVLGIGGVAAHVFTGLRRGEPGYAGRALVSQNWSAVTGACLAVRKERFDEVGGFEESLAVAFNDVDLCLKLRAAGYRNLWTPYAELYHHESATRARDDSSPEKARRLAREAEQMRRRWGSLLTADPAYNPQLSLRQPGFLAD